jgi:hypothetical protein
MEQEYHETHIDTATNHHVTFVSKRRPIVPKLKACGVAVVCCPCNTAQKATGKVVDTATTLICVCIVLALFILLIVIAAIMRGPGLFVLDTAIHAKDQTVFMASMVLPEAPPPETEPPGDGGPLTPT